jgi:NAD(P) transhydrogenase subunit alpha
MKLIVPSRVLAAATVLMLTAAAAAQPSQPPTASGPAAQTQPFGPVAADNAAGPPAGKAGVIQPAPIRPEPTVKSPRKAEPAGTAGGKDAAGQEKAPAHKSAESSLDFMTMLFVFMLATFIGVGVIRRVSRLLHTPLMSITNAISAIAVVGSIIVAGGQDYPTPIRVLGAVALFCSMTNIVSGFLITDRMLKMFKTRKGGKP